MLTTVGKQRLASHLANSNPGKTVVTHVALSENTEDVTINDLVIADEDYRSALDVSANNITCLGEEVITANDIDSGTYELNKLGILDASVGGNLICTHNLENTVELSGQQRLHIIHGLVITQ